MKKNTLLLILLVAIQLTSGKLAWAQASKKVARVGFLVASNRAAASARIEAFRQGMRQLGYVESKNFVIEFRFAEGKLDRVPGLAEELVRAEVDVIVTGGGLDTRAAKEATKTIAIVMGQDTDPVGSGLVASLARPGGNITGLSTLSPELSGKQLTLLKEIIPKLGRFAVLETSSEPGNARALEEIVIAARQMNLQHQFLDIVSAKDIEPAIRAAVRGNAQGLLVLGSPVINGNRTELIEYARKQHLPAIYRSPEYVEQGGLMSYGPNVPDLFRKAAIYVDKILKGTKPADLPVEQPTKFNFVINLKTAKAINLTIPQWTLMKADRVIK